MMKTTKIIALTGLTLSMLAVSCKKDNPVLPVNKNPDVPTECTFCTAEGFGLDSVLVNEAYAQQVSFFHYGNDEKLPKPNFRTPNGYYGYHEGMAIDFDLSQLLACMSNKVTFVHARNTTNTNDYPTLVNVKFPTTPLIVTTPDSLNYYLSPYGYSVQHFFQPGYVNMNTAGNGFTGVVDSIIITGPDFSRVTVGANLFESELRNICIAKE